MVGSQIVAIKNLVAAKAIMFSTITSLENHLMSNNSDKIQGRRRFLTGVGLVAATATVASSAKAASNNIARNGFTPTRHDEDVWMNGNSAGHRVFLDSSTSSGGVTAFNYANNIMVISYVHAMVNNTSNSVC